MTRSGGAVSPAARRRRTSSANWSSSTRRPCHFTNAHSRSTRSAEANSRCTSEPIRGWSRPLTSSALADSGTSGRSIDVGGPGAPVLAKISRSSSPAATRSESKATSGAASKMVAAIRFVIATCRSIRPRSSPLGRSGNDRSARRTRTPRCRANTTSASAGSRRSRSTRSASNP
jgi:hypothetical protein